MRTLTTLAALTALTAGAAIVQAQDAATYALDAEKKYEAGDVYTETGAENNTQKVKVSMGANVVQDQNEETKISYTTVTKVLAVNDQGEETKVLVYFQKFKRSEGGFDDDTLQGKVIEVTTAADGKSTWRHHAGEGNITSSARTWLDGEMSETSAKGRAAADDAFRPKQPVKVGDTWTPDMSKLVELMEMEGAGTSKATGECKLLKIEQRGAIELAHVSMTAEIPLEGLPGMEGAQIQWSEGGTMKIEHTGTVPTKARIAPGDNKMTFALKGKANMQGMNFEMNISGTMSATTTLGGEIPDLPLIPKPEAAPKDDGAGGGGK